MWNIARRRSIWPKLQDRSPRNWVVWEERHRDRTGALEGIFKGEKVHMGRPATWGASLTAGKSTETDKCLKKPRIYLWGEHMCCLDNNQGRETPILAAANLLYFPVQRIYCLSPTCSIPQPGERPGQRFNLAAQRQTWALMVCSGPNCRDPYQHKPKGSNRTGQTLPVHALG